MSVYALHAAALKALLPLLLSASDVRADAADSPTIEIFTTMDRPITITESARQRGAALTVYHVDGLERFEAYLSQALPRESAAAEAEALRRLQALNTTRLRSAKDAAHGLTLAGLYGIERSPAIVFDGHAVVYGVNDLHTALAQYQRWREAAP
jgi:integrating conjugative element protein (TIGR03757 family)